ncbi:RNAse P Rpr2/Rpp21/SNM1 subunit domain-containing protein [Durotheca rogersii]|uniref:RNAse P Rpr2/Rpp21/SNM1 subunit domain-containing protein n=1 Tax=Durotheca rogersii TaxID=419775 RepID=UPI00222095AC|nr:RNAse P Rpr2/Rpp21/SNM1 subunit domain-containing protein [Durotheca rogersii]KAI5867578.1 RNAse P Rpr2/Rpp21/SNM1 subunit domain-containing protein [Durotheca rogersii]
MAKSKSQGSVPNRPIYSRISYLYQAAACMATRSGQEASRDVARGPEGSGDPAAAASRGGRAFSRQLLADMRATSLKSQIRLSPDLKRTVCKFCDSFLVEGKTSSSVVENNSRGGKKPWADVFVIKCHTCGGVKRFPLHAPRQKRRPLRQDRQPTEGLGTTENPDRNEVTETDRTTTHAYQPTLPMYLNPRPIP